MSVYISDDLWDRVQRVQPGALGSQFIQETIREYVERRERRPYAVVPPELVAKREAAQARAQEALTADYRAGYEIGLELSEYLNWDLLHGFAELEWDFEKFHEFVSEAPREWFTTPHGEFDLDVVWEGLARRHDVADEWPNGALREGVVDALKDVWEPIANAGSQGHAHPKVPAPTTQPVPAAPADESSSAVVSSPEGSSDAEKGEA